MRFLLNPPLTRSTLTRFFGVFLMWLVSLTHAHAATPSEIIASAIVEQSASKQCDLVISLKGNPASEVVILLEKWKAGEIFLHQDPEGNQTPVYLTGKASSDGTLAISRVSSGAPLIGPDGNPVRLDPSAEEFVDTNSSLRRAMKEVSDLAAFANPDFKKRLRAIEDSAIGQNPEKIPNLEALRSTEKEPLALRAIDQTIAIINLKSNDPKVRTEACKKLGELNSIAAMDPLRTLATQSAKSGDRITEKAATGAMTRIESHISTINIFGTLFRGLSLGSVLLVVAIGLAITFGLMGIINMAHGEFIAIGAYTTYLMQHFLGAGLDLSPFGKSLSLPGLHLASAGNLYFVFALPASFLVAALFGILLEWSVIRFLYRRPLESLLATWGISMVLQQLLRLIFGSNNVQVTSPNWLSGNWTINDVLFGWNRVFVIAFAAIIILMTWLVLNKTSLGLMIRAAMQNRNMAACMGIRTERVNTMTFAFGCGLAGLAGAFLSQIGNVGPSLGQNYIVDAFMTVVVGGVGNLMGTVISALGIGLADQSLQQILRNPVIGKIVVLACIILFLQWRPAGLFVARSRSLD